MFNVFFICMAGMLIVFLVYTYYTKKMKEYLFISNKPLYLELEFDSSISQHNISKSIKFVKFIFWKYRNLNLDETLLGHIKKIRWASFIYLAIFIFFLFDFFHTHSG